MCYLGQLPEIALMGAVREEVEDEWVNVMVKSL
jgi:hypothetical protein